MPVLFQLTPLKQMFNFCLGSVLLKWKQATSGFCWVRLLAWWVKINQIHKYSFSLWHVLMLTCKCSFVCIQIFFLLYVDNFGSFMLNKIGAIIELCGNRSLRCLKELFPLSRQTLINLLLRADFINYNNHGPRSYCKISLTGFSSDTVMKMKSRTYLLGPKLGL